MRPRTGSTSGAGGPHRGPPPRTRSARSMAQVSHVRRAAGHHGTRKRPRGTTGRVVRGPRLPPLWRLLGALLLADFCVRPRPSGSGCSLPAGPAPPRPAPPHPTPCVSRRRAGPTSLQSPRGVGSQRGWARDGTEETTRGSSFRDFTSLLEGDRARRSTSGLRGRRVIIPAGALVTWPPGCDLVRPHPSRPGFVEQDAAARGSACSSVLQMPPAP